MKEDEGQAITQAFDAYQASVGEWLAQCLGAARGTDRAERTHRALEEALELAQACGCPEKDALALVRYVYARPTGPVAGEVGGVMVTVAALCQAFDVSLGSAAQEELERDWRRSAEIRVKAAAKRPGSPLPE